MPINWLWPSDAIWQQICINIGCDNDLLSDGTKPLTRIWLLMCGISPENNFPESTQIARFMRPTWGSPGSCQPQMGPMLTPWTFLLSGYSSYFTKLMGLKKMIATFPRTQWVEKKTEKKQQQCLMNRIILRTTIVRYHWHNCCFLDANAILDSTLLSTFFPSAVYQRSDIKETEVTNAIPQPKRHYPRQTSCFQQAASNSTGHNHEICLQPNPMIAFTLW